MKKLYLVGMLVLAVVLAASLLVACGGTEEETATTVAEETATTVAETATTVAAGAGEKELPLVMGTDIGLYGTEKGNNVLGVVDVPAPGLQFPISTEGDFAMVIEALGADGAVLGTLSTTTGDIDYTEFAGTAAKIRITTTAGDVYVYTIPAS